MSAPELLTVEDVARRLRVATRTIWRWSRSGEMPAPVRFGPRRRVVRWHAADIDRFLHEVLAQVPPLELDGKA